MYRDNRLRRVAGSLVLALSIVTVSTGGALAAWAPDFSSSPYTGLFVLQSPSGHKIGFAQYIKWNAAGVSAMASDSSPMLDMTADCTDDNPGADQLHYVWHHTSIPDDGFQAWTDCGSLSVWEEAELFIEKAAVVAEAIYDYQVHYEVRKTGVNGAINLTYQRSNSPTHDHLEKVLYSN